jgi:hypothetical protein
MEFAMNVQKKPIMIRVLGCASNVQRVVSTIPLLKNACWRRRSRNRPNLLHQIVQSPKNAPTTKSTTHLYANALPLLLMILDSNALNAPAHHTGTQQEKSVQIVMMVRFGTN